jgi:hypothetical protein
MLVIPSIFGKPLYLWLGLLVGSLVAFQIAVGARWIPVDFKVHRINGFVIGVVGLIHGAVAIAAYVFGVKVQGF